MDILHLDGLDEHDQPVIDGQPLLEARLLRTEQHDGHEGMFVFVGFVVHVDKRINPFIAETVDVEDHRVGGRLPVPLGRALRIADENDPVAQLRERLAERVLDLALGFDAEDMLLLDRLDLEIEMIRLGRSASASVSVSVSFATSLGISGSGAFLGSATGTGSASL